MKIVVDRNIPYIRGVLEPFAEVAYLGGGDIGAADIADADALVVRTRTKCDAELLASSNVRLVATATIGTDHIDTSWCAAHGVEVASAPGCNASGVLQWVAAALVELSRGRTWGHTGENLGVVDAGNTGSPEARSPVGKTLGSPEARSPVGKTLGVVGVGHVGSFVARYGREWGFEVICSDPPRERAEGLGREEGFVPLSELASRADIVTFHVPYTTAGPDTTANLAGAEFLGALCRGAAVINSSRGGVVDEGILAGLADAGKLIACLDTWVGEPSLNPRMLAAATIATPHIAGYSMQGKANATAAVVHALARRFSLPLGEWYPSGVIPVERRPIEWAELVATIDSHFDIAAETATLKASPEDFERLRNEYRYREEYF